MTVARTRQQRTEAKLRTTIANLKEQMAIRDACESRNVLIAEVATLKRKIQELTQRRREEG